MKRKLVIVGLTAFVATSGEGGALQHLALAQSGGSGSVTGTVTIQQGSGTKSDRRNVVVYLEGVPSPVRTPTPREMHQRDLSFFPWLLVVEKGTTINFPNDDKVFHNVFSVSRGARFDLGLYKSGSSKSVTFTEAGVVDIYCNIHPQMSAKVKVLDTSYFATTGEDGAFQIKNVPPGTYNLVGWQGFGVEYRGEVKVPAGGAAQVKIMLVEGDAPLNHLRKDGTPYGRYK